MSIEESLEMKINNFVKVCEKQLHENKIVYPSAIEIYYKAHVYLEILCLIRENEKTRALREKMVILTEDILENEK